MYPFIKLFHIFYINIEICQTFVRVLLTTTAAATNSHRFRTYTLAARTLIHQPIRTYNKLYNWSIYIQSMTHLPTYPRRVTCDGSRRWKNTRR